MGEQRLRVLRQSLKRCCTRSSWLAGTDIVLIGCPPSTVEWTADDTNSFSKIHAALPKGHLESRSQNYELRAGRQPLPAGGAKCGEPRQLVPSNERDGRRGTAGRRREGCRKLAGKGQPHPPPRRLAAAGNSRSRRTPLASLPSDLPCGRHGPRFRRCKAWQRAFLPSPGPQGRNAARAACRVDI